MTIDHYLTLATALMSIANTTWLLALVLEIRCHNNAVRLHNQRVPTPTNTTPPKAPPIDRHTTIDSIRRRQSAHVEA